MTKTLSLLYLQLLDSRDHDLGLKKLFSAPRDALRHQLYLLSFWTSKALYIASTNQASTRRELLELTTGREQRNHHTVHR